jgi:hypothetical protein
MNNLPLDRIQLMKKILWRNDCPVDVKEFYFVPRIFLLRELKVTEERLVSEVVDIDMSLTPLYIKEGEQVVMSIHDGKLDIVVTSQTA